MTVSVENPWRMGPVTDDYAIRGVRAVLPDRIVESATVVVRSGRIDGVSTAGADTSADLDGANLMLVPGFIDVHSDALESERMPRPGAEVPVEFALASFEGRIAGAGTTTMFHGAGFQHKTYRGIERDPSRAAALCRAIDATASYRVDHRVLHRLDVLSAPGAGHLRERLDALPAQTSGLLVSHEDHTPGQGQYADPSFMHRHLVDGDGLSPQEADTHIQRLVREREEKMPVREANLDWLAELAGRGRIRLMGHDPDTPDEIGALRARGGQVAEFPTTLAAARAARDTGLTTVAGAPNVLRGGSHSGNVSARELVAAGLVDALASDYLPTALLAAVTLLAREDDVSLPEAVSLITAGPAQVAGLDDRGAIAPGLRADFALVDDRIGPWPRVVTTLRAA
ncbi:alpha-D-ribose 1-methylphosphonate 5-triphosphate diphosphatase [Aeromicrobium sp. CTD01-1L150]|uniref:alpha-D-ribose 1-methylphosphonate 5-triphosphate diphosphatase n=1 Tax=Aeromicrobium sp. CTD01-1L150 TaxID=3341830 RepID=UPI0035C2397F